MKGGALLPCSKASLSAERFRLLPGAEQHSKALGSKQGEFTVHSRHITRLKRIKGVINFTFHVPHGQIYPNRPRTEGEALSGHQFHPGSSVPRDQQPPTSSLHGIPAGRLEVKFLNKLVFKVKTCIL